MPAIICATVMQLRVHTCIRTQHRLEHHASGVSFESIPGQIPAKNTTTSQDGFLVSKETVVLRQWERSKQKFGFMKQVNKG